MRTENSAKNLLSSLGITITMTLLGFITRKVFVDQVGVEYLGLNGLLQNILGVMTLLEGGFATSVVFNLYKPLAEDDRPTIIALLQLYRKVYRYIAFGLVVFAICLYPFIGTFIKDGENLSYISIVYFIFLFNSVIGYFSAYKWSIINASQQNYKLAKLNLGYQVGLSFAKLMILYYTGNYILYLVVEAIFNVGLNIGIVRKANQLFPYINTTQRPILPLHIRKNIIGNMKSLFLNNLGTYFMHSTDNIVTSTFVGVATIGLYSNYTLITQTVGSFVTQVFNSFSESVGNLVATENKEKLYEVFLTIYFVNFILALVPAVIMLNTLPHFIQWWLGKSYLLDNHVLWIIVVNYYITTMRTAPLIFKFKGGLFHHDRFTPLLQGIINVALSLLFVQYWGIFGVLLATTISVISIGFWQYPKLCYKYIFSKPLKLYFYKYALYTFFFVSLAVVTQCATDLVIVSNLLYKTILNAIMSLFTVMMVLWICFGRSKEFKDITHRLKLLISLKLKRNNE